MPRTPGSENEITKATREVFTKAFFMLGGEDRLARWAEGYETTCTTEKKNGNNLKQFYTLFAKTLPKHVKTEDINKSQENFVKWIQAEEERLRLEAGQPHKLIDSPVKVAENTQT